VPVWLEGYLLTGRQWIFFPAMRRSFTSSLDVHQHAKWLKTTRTIPWRNRCIAELFADVARWRQDHNGFSHQDPGFIDHVANKRQMWCGFICPPDTNCLLSVADHLLYAVGHYVNLIVAGKQPARTGSTWIAALTHCTTGRAHGLGGARSGLARLVNGVRRGRADAGDSLRRCRCCGRTARPAHSRGERGRSDGPATTDRASPGWRMRISTHFSPRTTGGVRGSTVIRR